MTYFARHIFFCNHQRDNGKECCHDYDAKALTEYAKARSKALGFKAKGLRVNKAGCLDRCSWGPVAVVYPEGVWYSYSNQADIDRILQEHMQHGNIVEELRLPDQ